MAKSVQLPFNVPAFAATQGSAAAGMAIKAHGNAYNQTLNQAVSINCSRRFINGFSSPIVTIPNIGLHNYKFIERYGVGFRFTFAFCMDIIKHMLDENFYIYYTCVDDFYMPGKSWYGTRHMYHDGIICGYDDNDGTFSIAGYDINWVFSLMRIPQECFIKGAKSALDVKEYGGVVAYKIRDNTVVEINEAEMLTYLKKHIDSDLEKYPIDQAGDATGSVVHEYLAMYIDKLKDGSIPYEKMDWRSLRPMWEHKKCMLDRIKAVEAKNGWNDELSQKYLPVVEKADRLRMMYAVYYKNRNDKLLDKIHNGLLDIGIRDKELVTEFIEKIERLTL